MKRFIKFIVPALALGLFALIPNLTVRADDAPPATQPSKATGSITIKVVDSNGNVVSGVSVSIVNPPAPGAAPAGRGNRPKPVATGTTDANGLVTIKNIPVGDYSATARDRTAGNGRVKVTIAADAPADAAPTTLTLKPRAAGGGGGNGNGNAN